MIVHCCLDVEGFLKSAQFPKDFTRMLKRVDGASMSPVEARDELFECIRRGWKVIPFGPCDNFDYQTGCRGHEQAADEVPR